VENMLDANRQFVTKGSLPAFNREARWKTTSSTLPIRIFDLDCV
jgi:hypothetical protein